ncbi:DNA helicase [Tanacetum coccineum]
MDTNRLCKLTSAADSLQLKPLVDLTSRALARMIEGKTPEEIHETFHIPDDFKRLYARKRKELKEKEKLKGHAIQANMDVKNTDYFDHLLRLHKAYRISDFGCEETDTWEKTLDNKWEKTLDNTWEKTLDNTWEKTLDNDTSLIFGKLINTQQISNNSIPEHYFDFATYNELAHELIPRLQFSQTILAVSSELADGNMIGLTLWNEMATEFHVHAYEKIEKPVVIAVASCWVTRYNGLQLSGISTTHYYLNPNIPETFHIREMHTQTTDAAPILDVAEESLLLALIFSGFHGLNQAWTLLSTSIIVGGIFGVWIDKYAFVSFTCKGALLPRSFML